jgi:hypothetical protein
MRDLFRLVGWMVVDLFRSRAALEAEIWTLLQQINVLRRTAPKRVSFSVFDRLLFAGLYRLFPKICDALAIVKPDTIVSLASRGIQIVLALEVATSWRSANGAARNTPADPGDEHRKSTLGRAARPRRASQARHRYRTDERGQVYGEA